LNLDNETLKKIVEEVVTNFLESKSINISVKPSSELGVFSKVDDAVKAARKAYEELQNLKLEERAKIIEAIRETGRKYTSEIAKMTVEETGMGRYEDKLIKIRISTDRTPGIEDLTTEAWSGDHGLTIVERSPFGVITAVTPSTHPVPTLINNAISMISAGNSVVFNPHPGAKKVFLYALKLINEAIVKAGGPENLLCAVSEPTIETTQECFGHPLIDLIVVTGGPGVVKEAMKYSKRVIAAGPGNPPVVVDETADIKKAAKNIVDGATFDNNIFCTAEKEIFVVESVADKLKRELLNYHCYELTYNQMNKLADIVVTDKKAEHPVMNRKFVGKNATVLAEAIGLKIDESVRLLIGEVDETHILVSAEQLMPVMPIVRVKDVDEAIEKAIKYEHNFRHSAIMHSLNLKALDKMAKLSRVTIFVKNGPSYAGLGVGGQGTTTYTIAGVTGEGITTARTFTRQRRCVLVDYFRIV